MYIDSHAHVNFNAFKDDADEVIKRTLKEGVFLINVGSQYSTSARAVEMAGKYERGVYAAVGIHPIHLSKKSVELETDNQELRGFESVGEKFNYKKYKDLAIQDKVVAIGEVGLDYHHFEPKDDVEKVKKLQKEVLVEFVKLANELDKPMIIHCWDAYEDLYEILKKYPVNPVRNSCGTLDHKGIILNCGQTITEQRNISNGVKNKGVIHSFIGSWKTAQKFLELEFKLGFNGITTYSESYDKVLKKMPLESLLIETDCPYLTPAPKDKSERNEPLWVRYVAEKITKVRGTSVSELAEATTKNAKELFGIVQN